MNLAAVRSGARAESVTGAWRWFLNAAAVVGAAAVALAIVLSIMGARVLIFSSGSMAPAIPAGSAAITMPRESSELLVGEVISVPRAGDGQLVTHRIVALTPHGSSVIATLQGDANPGPDPVPYPLGTHTQRVVLSAPQVGSILAAVKSPWILGAILALVVLAAIPSHPSRSKTEQRAAA